MPIPEPQCGLPTAAEDPEIDISVQEWPEDLVSTLLPVISL